MASKNSINNDFYCDLGMEWMEGINHPIALLRAENALRNPWIAQTIGQKLPSPTSVLDIGCGAGLLTQFLSSYGHKVSGIDLSEKSLEIARKKDVQQKIDYRSGNAAILPFKDGQFDVVCAMDLLEHVENPEQVIAEASRVLKTGGLFFFHTFNRNFLSYLIIIKGVDWCFKNAPKNMHIYPLFIKPKELTNICQNAGLLVEELKGVTPAFLSKSLWKLIFKGKADDSFRFSFTSSLKTGYCGYAIKI